MSVSREIISSSVTESGIEARHATLGWSVAHVKQEHLSSARMHFRYFEGTRVRVAALQKMGFADEMRTDAHTGDNALG
jgi:hypothetical protein